MKMHLFNHVKRYTQIYNDSQKHESTLIHMYVLNEFLTADH